MSKKIFISGGTGFIGSHLIEYLLKKKYSISTLVEYNSFNNWGWLDTLSKKQLDKVTIFSGDIKQKNDVLRSMQSCDSVIHLASLIAIPYSYKSPKSYIDTNVIGTLNILEASKQLKIKKIIHTSTSEVYGTAKYVPIDENHPIQTQSPYAASKSAADQLAYSFYKSFNLPIVTLRPFNTYGPRQSARAVIPSMIVQILNGKKKINVGSLTPTRDFNYVHDICDAFYRALISDNINGKVINIGSNFEISIRDTLTLISEILNINIKTIKSKERFRPTNSEVNRLFSNNNLAKELLNWKPLYHGRKGFEKGLIKTIKWFSKVENRKFYKSDLFNY
jgi:NAD dependent epimerase/dehydratase